MTKPTNKCMNKDCERAQVAGMLFCPEHARDKYEHVPFDAEPNDDVIMWANKDGKTSVPADPTWRREKDIHNNRPLGPMLAFMLTDTFSQDD